MNRPGPTGPQNLRTIPGNMFSQQTAASRGAPLSSGRLQNGKLSNSSSWFGMGTGNAQSRGSNTGFSTFAQTIGGGPQQSSLDPSEFPSLSGTQQPQQSTSIWSNPNLRAGQHTPVQRPQASSNAAQVSSGHQPSTHSPDGAAPGSTVSPFAPGADGYRFGGQGGVGQLAGLSQTQSGNVEEFPPLGGLGNGDMGPERRGDPIQNAFTSSSSGSTQQSRLGLTNPLGEQRERNLPSTIGENRVSSSNTQLGQLDRSRGATVNPGFSHTDESSVVYNLQVQSSAAGSQGNQSLPPDSVDSSQTTTQRPQQKRLADMTDKERYGLTGFLATIDPTHADYSPLALGQDLTQIGLDLSRPDSSPLYPTFATPFADSDSRQIVPEFQLPPSYTVNNVPPLVSKIPSFSEDTLFAIFYQYPRDILQELAAQELFNRDWRYHTQLRQWMQKDQRYGPPTPLTNKQERGFYIFFDAISWRKDSREFLLNYDHLDQRHTQVQPTP